MNVGKVEGQWIEIEARCGKNRNLGRNGDRGREEGK